MKTDLAKRNQEFIDSRTEINQLLLQVSRHAEEINEKEQIINNYVNLIPKYQQLLDQKETDMQESLYKAGLKETTKLLMAQEIYSKNLDEKDEKIKCLEEECVELNSKVFDLKAQVLELTGQAAVFMNEVHSINLEWKIKC